MKVIILAGGLGTRLGEESTVKPKCLVEIGGKPIIWHIMKHFMHYGHFEFIICGGYKVNMIKDYFRDYAFYKDKEVQFYHQNVNYDKSPEPWKVTVVDTGLETNTAGRLAMVSRFIDEDESVFMTYGDGLSNIDINALHDFHGQHDCPITVTAVKRDNKFGVLDLNEDGMVKGFVEKPQSDDYINGGYFIIHKDIFSLIKTYKVSASFEFDVMPLLAKQNLLMAFKLNGFWKCMDTQKDKNEFEQLHNDRLGGVWYD